MQLLMSGLGALIMAAICGLSVFFVIADKTRDHGAETAVVPPRPTRDISSQAVDGRPLSLSEVFPDAEIRLADGAAPYRIGMTHIDTDCDIATTGTLGALLADDGCTQLVRAALTAPYGDYRVTAGLFNLPRAADRIGDEVSAQVEAGAGSFAAMATGLPGTDAGAQPLTQVAWRSRGHFLIYCVIARPDGQPVRDDDRYAQRITADLIGSYLDTTVIGKRTESFS